VSCLCLYVMCPSSFLTNFVMVLGSRQLRRDMLEATSRKLLLLLMMMIHQKVRAVIKTTTAVRIIITRLPPSAFWTTTHILTRHSWTRILPQCVHVRSVKHSLEVVCSRFRPSNQFMHAQMHIGRNIRACMHSATNAMQEKVCSMNPLVEVELNGAVLNLHLIIVRRTSSDYGRDGAKRLSYRYIYSICFICTHPLHHRTIIIIG